MSPVGPLARRHCDGVVAEAVVTCENCGTESSASPILEPVAGVEALVAKLAIDRRGRRLRDDAPIPRSVTAREQPAASVPKLSRVLGVPGAEGSNFDHGEKLHMRRRRTCSRQVDRMRAGPSPRSGAPAASTCQLGYVSRSSACDHRAPLQAPTGAGPALTQRCA